MKQFIFQNMPRRAIVVLAIMAFVCVFPAEARRRKYHQVSATAAIFSNSTEVVRYYGKNVHQRVQPASTVKVMTALLVLEKLALDKQVSFSRRATLVQPTKLHARPGERFCVRDLLYALLLSSANDASIALAEAVAGSEEAFVSMMNKRARDLGAYHTLFANSNGLPSKNQKQYTTAYDMYLIFRQVLKQPFFKEAIGLKYKTIYSSGGRSFQLKNHNKILFFKNWRRQVYGKTGYTRAARACFVGYLMKGQSVCIIAVFGCAQRWSDIQYIISKYGNIDL